MDKEYLEEKIKKEERVHYANECGIVDNITCRAYDYPKDFYQVLDDLDIVMRIWAGEKMGTSGTDELMTLCSVIELDCWLQYYMPKHAKMFFEALLNPQKSSLMCSDAGLGFGHAYRAYSELRTYLIDNKERVAKTYAIIIEQRELSRREDEYRRTNK